MIEKPFGTDLATARELNDAVHEVFAEQQVYRIDHYLGKETVQNILVLRFANTHLRADLEPQLHRPRADHRGRGSDRRPPRRLITTTAGVLRDMFQNHLLQLLTLTAMEAPVALRGRRRPRRKGEGAAVDPRR